jgi:lipopolysaccharide exporter
MPGPGMPEPGTILEKTARGAGWVIGWRMSTRLLGLLNTLVLVRLLAPADFGLVALGSGFALAVDMLSGLGVEEAIVRHQAPRRDIYDTGFTINALRGLATASIIAAIAVPVAGFFSEPRLENVLLALAVATAGTAFTNIGTVDFRRQLAFDKEFRLLVLPRIAGILVTIALALVCRSYWALVGGILTGRLSVVALSYAMHPYRPRFTLRAWRDLAGFSFWSWAISIAVLVRDRSDTFVIGRVLGAAHVGLYEVGMEIATLPSTELVEPLTRACFPGFAAARHSGVSTVETYLRVISSVALLALPAGVGISLVAEPVVKLALGNRWLDAIPLIQILGLAGSLTVFGYISATLFSAHALLKTLFSVSISVMLLRLLLLAVLVVKLGLVGAAIAASLSMAVEHAVYIVLTMRRFGLRPAALLRHVWRSIFATAVMAGALVAAGLGWAPQPAGTAPLEELLLAVGLGVLVYASALGATWLAAGRPAGAETDLLSFAALLARRAAGSLRHFRMARPATTGD